MSTVLSLISIAASFIVFELFLSYPFNSLAVLPVAEFDDVVCVLVYSDALLLSIEPSSIILATVRPRKYAMSLLLVVVVVAGVLAAIGPSEVASAVHFVADPVAFVNAPVGPPVLAEPVDVVVEKVAFVR